VRSEEEGKRGREGEGERGRKDKRQKIQDPRLARPARPLCRCTLVPLFRVPCTPHPTFAEASVGEACTVHPAPRTVHLPIP